MSRSIEKPPLRRDGGSFTCQQAVVTKELLRAHHIEHENPLAIETVENPARGLDDLAIARAIKIR